jgi:hypothetical protein
MDAWSRNDASLESGTSAPEPRPGLPRLVGGPTSPTWIGDLRGLSGGGEAWVRGFDLEPLERPPKDTLTGRGRGTPAANYAGVWAANAQSRNFTRLDPHTLEITAMIPMRCEPVAIVASPDEVWLVCRNGWLYKASAPGPSAEGVARLGRGVRRLALSGSELWALSRAGELLRVDADSGDVDVTTLIGRGTIDLVAAGDRLWVASAPIPRLLGNRCALRADRGRDLAPGGADRRDPRGGSPLDRLCS